MIIYKQQDENKAREMHNITDYKKEKERDKEKENENVRINLVFIIIV